MCLLVASVVLRLVNVDSEDVIVIGHLCDIDVESNVLCFLSN